MKAVCYSSVSKIQKMNKEKSRLMQLFLSVVKKYTVFVANISEDKIFKDVIYKWKDVQCREAFVVWSELASGEHVAHFVIQSTTTTTNGVLQNPHQTSPVHGHSLFIPHFYFHLLFHFWLPVSVWYKWIQCLEKYLSHSSSYSLARKMNNSSHIYFFHINYHDYIPHQHYIIIITQKGTLVNDSL